MSIGLQGLCLGTLLVTECPMTGYSCLCSKTYEYGLYIVLFLLPLLEIFGYEYSPLILPLLWLQFQTIHYRRCLEEQHMNVARISLVDLFFIIATSGRLNQILTDLKKAIALPTKIL